MLTALAAVAAAVVLAGWLLYPVVLAALSRPRQAPSPAGGGLPPVTIVVATRDAPDLLAARVRNLFDADYPEAELSVIVAVDVGSPFPLVAYQDRLRQERSVSVVSGDPPGGKAAALNAAMRRVTTDLVVFADSAQRFEAGAIAALARALESDTVGCVSGEMVTEAERGVFGLFWRYELWLRSLESRAGRVVAVSGAFHAIRWACWKPLPSNLICDDLLIPLRTARLGYRVIAEPRARASDGRRFSREEQIDRKVRTLTGMLQICAWEPWVLLPWKNRIWASFVCHKLVRVATPFLVLFVAGAALFILPSAVLIPMAIAAAVLLGVVLAVAIRLAGYPPRRVGLEALWALRLLLTPLKAARNAFLGKWDVWRVTTQSPNPEG